MFKNVVWILSGHDVFKRVDTEELEMIECDWMARIVIWRSWVLFKDVVCCLVGNVSQCC